MSSCADITRALTVIADTLSTVVPFDPATDTVASLDLSPANPAFGPDIYNDMDRFTAWIEEQRMAAGARYLVGGYRETREMYRRSDLFVLTGEQDSEARSLHIGTDVWAPAGTPVFAPLKGTIHSFAFNDNFGDYGATIIMEHKLPSCRFFSLYGHLSQADLIRLRVGNVIDAGEEFAHFGQPKENGHWPPHLHIQIIIEMSSWSGDYPGVCKQAEAANYLSNSPDPDLLLQLNRFLPSGQANN
jgi:murein DD-endopeptidase MepM/ murein hydrolase activator NlpD